MKQPRHLILLIYILMSMSMSAQYSIEWTGAKNNLWTEPDNWNQGRVPEEQDVVLINTGDTVLIKATPSAINRLDVSQSGLIISPGVEFTIGGGINNGFIIAAGYLENNGTFQILETQGDAVIINFHSVCINNTELIISEATNHGIRNFNVLTNNGSIVIQDIQNKGIDNLDTLLNHGDIIIRDFASNPDPTVFGEAGIFNNLDDYILNTGNIEIRDGEDGVPAFENRGGYINQGSLSISKALEGIINRDSIINSGNINLTNSMLSTISYFENSTGASLRLNIARLINNGTFINNTGLTIDSSTTWGLDNTDIFINNDSIFISRVRFDGINNDGGAFLNNTEAYINIYDIGINGVDNRPNSTIDNDGTIHIKTIRNAGINNLGTLTHNGEIKLDSINGAGIFNQDNVVTRALRPITISNSYQGIVNQGGFVHGGIITIDQCDSPLFNTDRFIVLGRLMNPGIPDAHLIISNFTENPFTSETGSLFEVWGNISIE